MNEVNVGIYRITCIVNGRVYFGSSCELSVRMPAHKWKLARGVHGNRHLQADWNLYGPDAFEFRVLIRHQLSKRRLLDLEDMFIQAHWDGQVWCYNVAQEARSTKGRKHTPETRAKLSALARGRKLTPETRAKISEAGKGRKPSPETRVKLSAVQRDPNHHNPRNLGHKHSEETRAKMSKARTGCKASEETLEKMSLAHTGHTESVETRAKKSEAMKIAWARKRSLVGGVPF